MHLLDAGGFPLTGAPLWVPKPVYPVTRTITGDGAAKKIQLPTAAIGPVTILVTHAGVVSQVLDYTRVSDTIMQLAAASDASDTYTVSWWSDVRTPGQLRLIAGGGASILAKLSAWWDLSESSGNRADSVAAFTMVPDAGAVATADGPRGSGDTCVSLSGSGGLVATSLSGDALDTAASFCVFGWMRAGTNHNGFAASRWDAMSSASLSYAITTTSTYALGANCGGSGYNSAPSLTCAIGTWYFVCAWRDSSDGHMRLEVNADGSPTVSTQTYIPTAQNMNLCLGRTNYSTTFQAFRGRLSRWGYIKGNTLSLTEREWLYNGGIGRDFSEL